jgi:hypothetical protein
MIVAAVTRGGDTKDGCSGSCEGIASGVVVVRGKCPQQPDAEAAARARRRAEREAKAAARAVCRARGGAACRCSGEVAVKFESATTQQVEGCGDVCVYEAAVRYVGECKPAT